MNAILQKPVADTATESVPGIASDRARSSASALRRRRCRSFGLRTSQFALRRRRSGAATVLDSDFSSDADGASDVENPYTFTGRRLDAESGLMQYRNRYYDPGLGRFAGRDPAGHSDAPNFYLYVQGRPTVSTDPLGLFCNHECGVVGARRNCKAKLVYVPAGHSPSDYEDFVPAIRDLLADTKGDLSPPGKVIGPHIADGVKGIIQEGWMERFSRMEGWIVVTWQECVARCCLLFFTQNVWEDKEEVKKAPAPPAHANIPGFKEFLRDYAGYNKDGTLAPDCRGARWEDHAEEECKAKSK